MANGMCSGGNDNLVTSYFPFSSQVCAQEQGLGSPTSKAASLWSSSVSLYNQGQRWPGNQGQQ